MVQLTCHISKKQNDRIVNYARSKKLAVYRVGSLLVAEQLDREDAFDFGLQLDIPNSEDLKLDYPNEGGILMDYFRLQKTGRSMDDLIVHRYDIGIEDKQVLKTVLGECVAAGMVEAYIPIPRGNMTVVGEDFWCYRVKKQATPRASKKRGTQYEQYLKLKKKFKDVEE